MMTKSGMRAYALLVVAAAMLAGCSECNCPKCPGRTTVVNPAGGATVVQPDSNY